jgi:glycosyltransferase involved in cell wall biosynthesis
MSSLEDPTVSVIIPTYNRAYLVGRAIQSVLEQTYQDFELIVVDDGSCDNTEDVVRSFHDRRIKYIRHMRNKGAAAARNTGIKAAKGKYIAFQDSDDEWVPEKLEKQIRMFENAPSKVGVVYTGLWRLRGNKRIYIPSTKITTKDGDIHGELLKGNFVSIHALVKNECFGKAGLFDERLPRLQDWELFIRISKYYYFKYIDEPLVISHCMPDSISVSQGALVKALQIILEKHHEEFKRDRRLLASHQYWIGNLLCQDSKVNQGRQYLLKAVRAHPLNAKYLLALIISLFGGDAYSKAVRLKSRIRQVKGSYKKICGFSQ